MWGRKGCASEIFSGLGFKGECWDLGQRNSRKAAEDFHSNTEQCTNQPIQTCQALSFHSPFCAFLSKTDQRVFASEVKLPRRLRGRGQVATQRPSYRRPRTARAVCSWRVARTEGSSSVQSGELLPSRWAFISASMARSSAWLSLGPVQRDASAAACAE